LVDTDLTLRIVTAVPITVLLQAQLMNGYASVTAREEQVRSTLVATLLNGGAFDALQPDLAVAFEAQFVGLRS
jgi:hypothetical protein